MSSAPHCPLHVVTRSDIPSDTFVVSLDNSAFARLNDPVERSEGAEPILRLLRLFKEPVLRCQLKVQFVISQALHYDRINDPDPLRLMMPLLIEVEFPEQIGYIKEIPVARVESKLSLLPAPAEVVQIEQDGLLFDRRMTTVIRDVDRDSELAELFIRHNVALQIPICVYEPGDVEERSAKAFGFNSFAYACSRPRRIADVCYVASHIRFGGDVLVACDPHFNKEKLAEIGVDCVTPNEFFQRIDPFRVIKPIEID